MILTITKWETMIFLLSMANGHTDRQTNVQHVPRPISVILSVSPEFASQKTVTVEEGAFTITSTVGGGGGNSDEVNVTESEAEKPSSGITYR